MGLGCPRMSLHCLYQSFIATVPGEGHGEGKPVSKLALTSLWLCPSCLTSLVFNFV